MAADADDRTGGLSRRDTLRLATAVSALGVGLGVALDGPEAGAAMHKIDPAAVGTLTLKLYKLSPDGKASQLLHTLDLNAITQSQFKGARPAGTYAIKLYNVKGPAVELLGEHELQVQQSK